MAAIGHAIVLGATDRRLQAIVTQVPTIDGFASGQPTDLALSAYERALEPKSLVLMPGGHYTAYLEGFEVASKAAVDWFRKHL
jgi:hypothetical protein